MKNKTLQRHYKYQVSGSKQWEQLPHAADYLIYPENVAAYLNIDEVSLSKGELYTFVTNKNTGVKNKKSVVAIISGTGAKTIEEVLERICLSKREETQEVSMDMAPNMGLPLKIAFPIAVWSPTVFMW